MKGVRAQEVGLSLCYGRWFVVNPRTM